MAQAAMVQFPGSGQLSGRDAELLKAAEAGAFLRRMNRGAEGPIICFRPETVGLLKPMFKNSSVTAAVILSQILYWFELSNPDDPTSWRTKFFDADGLPTCTLTYDKSAELLHLDRSTVFRVWQKLEDAQLLVTGKIKHGEDYLRCVRPNFSNLLNLLKKSNTLL